jgi:hypothetical protein
MVFWVVTHVVLDVVTDISEERIFFFLILKTEAVRSSKVCNNLQDCTLHISEDYNPHFHYRENLKQISYFKVISLDILLWDWGKPPTISVKTGGFRAKIRTCDLWNMKLSSFRLKDVSCVEHGLRFCSWQLPRLCPARLLDLGALHLGVKLVEREADHSWLWGSMKMGNYNTKWHYQHLF